MSVLYFYLGLVFYEFFREHLGFLLLSVHLSSEILDIFIDLATLTSHVLNLGLQLASQSVQLFYLAVLICKLSLQSPFVLCLLFPRVIFQTCFQIVEFLEGVSDFDLVLLL